MVLEEKTGQKVVSKNNFLGGRKNKNLE